MKNTNVLKKKKTEQTISYVANGKTILLYPNASIEKDSNSDDDNNIDNDDDDNNDDDDYNSKQPFVE